MVLVLLPILLPIQFPQLHDPPKPAELCFTEEVIGTRNSSQFNSKPTKEMYVRFNNIFENKSKLNSLLKQNNSRQKSESSSDMLRRLLVQARNQGHAAQASIQGHAAQANNQNNTNN